MDRGHVDAAVGVDEIPAIRRKLDRVAAVALGQGDQSGAVEIDAVVMDEVRILVGVLAAGAEPDLPLLLVDAVDAADDVRALGDLVLDLAGLGVDQVEVPPAVALGDVDDLVGPVEPGDGAAGRRSRDGRSR